MPLDELSEWFRLQTEAAHALPNRRSPPESSPLTATAPAAEASAHAAREAQDTTAAMVWSMSIASSRSAPYDLWLVPVVSLLAVVCCYPFVNLVAWLGDEGIWLHGADRLLRGYHLYADFFEFHPPLGFWIVEWWFHLFGPSIITARWLAILTVVLIAAFTYLSCLEASDNALISAGLTLCWVIWSQQEWPPQVNHHWFTTLFSMISAWAALKHLRRRSTALVWGAGISAGCATLVTHNRGALIALALLITVPSRLRDWSVVASFIGGCALVPAVVVFYFLGTGRALDAFRDIILFPVYHYSSIQWVPFGSGAVSPLKYFYQLLFVLLVLFGVLNVRRIGRDRVLWTAVAIAVAGLLGAFPRPDLVHIGFSLPLALPLTAYCGASFARRQPLPVKLLSVTCVIALLVPSTRRFYYFADQALRVPLIATPRGEVALPDATERELVAALQHYTAHTHFFYPYMPMLPFLMDVRQVSKLDVFVPHYTTGYQYRETCHAVVGQASLVVMDRLWADEKFLQWVFPAMPKTPDPTRYAWRPQSPLYFVPFGRTSASRSWRATRPHRHPCATTSTALPHSTK
jgi:hypothetical protein